MLKSTYVLYTRHLLLNFTCDLANGSIASWSVPKDHRYFWIFQEMGVTPCLSDPLIIQHNDTCLLALIFPQVLYHKQEESLAQKHKREPLMTQDVTTLLRLGVARTSLGTLSVMILQYEMRVICSQLTATLEKTETASHYL